MKEENKRVNYQNQFKRSMKIDLGDYKFTIKKKLDCRDSKHVDQLKSINQSKQYQINQDELYNKEIIQDLQLNPIETIKQAKQYQFGNYAKYYNHRYEKRWQDPRLKVFIQDTILNKTVLDIGCNDGSLTLMIAIKYFPKQIIGLDIDYNLINKAVDNLKFLEKQQAACKPKEPSLTAEEQQQQSIEQHQSQNQEILDKLRNLPKCFLINLDLPNNQQDKFLEQQYLEENKESIFEQQDDVNKNNIDQEEIKILKKFPDNIQFRIENYIQDIQLIERYDTIICFSITKWIHLNYGDCGIKRLFKKVFDSLNPGGTFYLEPQEFSSYKKKKKFCDKFTKTIKSIQLHPKQFNTFLTDVIGFQLEKVCNPDDLSKDNKCFSFKRSIYIYKKPKHLQN